MLTCPGNSSIGQEIKILAAISRPKDLDMSIRHHTNALLNLMDSYEFLYLSMGKILGITKPGIKHNGVKRTDTVLIEAGCRSYRLRTFHKGKGGEICLGTTADQIERLSVNGKILECFILLDQLLRSG